MIEKNGSKVTRYEKKYFELFFFVLKVFFLRSFKPDFVLIRQHVRDAETDWRSIIIGLKYGCIETINSLDSVYNFRDKPWVVSYFV
jgi:hypothetical protein